MDECLDEGRWDVWMEDGAGWRGLDGGRRWLEGAGWSGLVGGGVMGWK